MNNKTRIAQVGLGTMGKIVVNRAAELGYGNLVTIDPFSEQANFRQIDSSSVNDVDVCICFTTPDVAMDNIRKISSLGKDIVMATTGWLDHLEEAREIVAKAGTGLIYSSNFSLGVNIFFKIAEQAATMVNHFDIYDVAGWEVHHNRKADAPSGTAKTIAKILLDNIDRKTMVVEEKPGKMKPEEMHFASIRVGDVPGEHSVMFDSPFDSIRLTHSARNRQGFADGALKAASWIKGKKGVFTEEHLIDAILTKKI